MISNQEDLDAPRYWRVAEAVEQTGLSASWFYHRYANGKLPGATRAGKYLLLKVDEFIAALDAGQID